MDFRFAFQWEPAPTSVRSVELRETWARLEIFAGTRCLTQAEDVETQSVRRSISVSLYPLAEWVAYNWWLLVGNSRAPGARERLDRRNMRIAGDGFVWPDIQILPAGPSTLVSVRSLEPLVGQSLRYLNPGEFWVDSAQLREALGGLVGAVLDRLVEVGLSDTALAKEWQSLATLDKKEQEFCLVAARLGLEPFSEGVDIANEIDSAFSALAPELLDDFFDGGLAIELGGDVAWVRQALYTVVNSGVNYNPSRLSEFAVAVRGDQTSLVGKVPWNVGFTAARSAREALNFSPSETVYDLPVLVLGTTTHKRFSGVGIAQRKGYTTIAVPSRVHNVTKRFAACRALWHASLLEGSSRFCYRIREQRTSKPGAHSLLNFSLPPLVSRLWRGRRVPMSRTNLPSILGSRRG